LFQPLFDNLPQSLHCYSSYFKKWGRAGETQIYYCKNCQKTFNNKTKTPLAKLYKCHIWEEYGHCMGLKITLREAASMCNINLKAAFLWRHHFLVSQSGKYSDKLSGIIEVDEFFFTYSEKGDKKLTQKPAASKRGGNVDKRTKEGRTSNRYIIYRSQ
jgi:transposase-like protein